MKKINKTSYLKSITKITTIALFVLLALILFFLLLKFFSFLLQRQISANDERAKRLCDFIIFILQTIITIIITKFTKLPRIIKACYYSVVRIIYKCLQKIKRIKTKNIFINDFSVNELPFESQQNIVDSLIKQKEKFVLVYGVPSSGKTKSLFYILDDSSEKSDLFQILDNHIVYISKATEKDITEYLISNYKLKHFNQDIILFDDFSTLADITKHRIMNEIIIPSIDSNVCYAKSIVIISEKIDQLLLNRNNPVVSYEVKQSGINFRKHIIKIDEFLAKYNIGDDKFKLWLYSVFQSGQGEKTLLSILEEKNLSLLELFICIVVVCLYSNTCKIKTIKNLFSKGNKTFRKYFNILLEANIISYFPFYKSTVYFNHHTANYFRTRFLNNSIYKEIFNRYYINGLAMRNINYADQWLYFIEYSFINSIDNQNNKIVYFKNAFSYGNYQYLLEQTELVLRIYERFEKLLYRELGYLYEKVGKRIEAVDYLNKYIRTSNSAFEIQQSELLLFEITHHYNQNLANIIKLKKSTNHFIRIQAQYWEEHINIEKGNFRYEEMKNILEKYLSYQSEWKSELNYFHMLRRMFSDLARVYFLGEVVDYEKAEFLEHTMEKSYLKLYHPEYNDFFCLLNHAHYIHYDVIFQLGFFGHLRHQCKGERMLKEEAIDKSLAIYNQCETNLKNNGDKAWITIFIRKTELSLVKNAYIDMITDLKNIKNDFIATKNTIHIAFINCILCKAKFLYYYQNELDCDFNGTYKMCDALLNEAYEFYNSVNNTYGMARVDFMRCFLVFFENSKLNKDLSKAELLTKLPKLDVYKYAREKEMIDYILNKSNIEIDLSYRFFAYYPIILQ